MPTSQRRTEFVSRIEDVYGPNVFDDPSGPQSSSLNWLVESDQAEICPGAENAIQRYILGVLFYTTSGSSWVACSNVSNEDCTGDSFLSGSNECEWVGIGCNSDGLVTRIHLNARELSGSIPQELGNLDSLTELTMEENDLSGSIPATLGKLQELSVIDLDNNSLTGELPEELFNATKLVVLDLDNNSLSGDIPTTVANLPNLYYLQLDKNLFIGRVPTQLANLNNLKYLSLFSNFFSYPVSDLLCQKDGLIIHADCIICAEDDCCTVCLGTT